MDLTELRKAIRQGPGIVWHKAKSQRPERDLEAVWAELLELRAKVRAAECGLVFVHPQGAGDRRTRSSETSPPARRIRSGQ